MSLYLYIPFPHNFELESTKHTHSISVSEAMERNLNKQLGTPYLQREVRAQVRVKGERLSNRNLTHENLLLCIRTEEEGNAP
jgi:hypothetical protein